MTTNGTMQFQKATKKQAKLRLALFGPSGAGKTYSALRLATGMGGTIGVIDSEKGSSNKYADKFDFSVLTIEDKTVEKGYLPAIEAAGFAGIEVLIIDSISHAWQELLEMVDKVAATDFGGNSWAGWSKATPIQKRFVEALLGYPGHLICTIRSKTAWEIQDDGKGKKKPTRVGLAPEQRGGIEYEFDMLMELNVSHSAKVLKDRTDKYQDEIIDKPDEKMGKELMAWLNDGEAEKLDWIDLCKTDKDLADTIKDVLQMKKSQCVKLWDAAEHDAEKFKAAVMELATTNRNTGDAGTVEEPPYEETGDVQPE